jgi:AbrB family looped-hinge helix DNA binding protein
MVTRMREKGQVTIPADIRESLSLDTDSILSVTKVGDGILLTPQPSVFEATSAKFVKAAKSEAITLEELLQDLKKIRHQDS